MLDLGYTSPERGAQLREISREHQTNTGIITLDYRGRHVEVLTLMHTLLDPHRKKDLIAVITAKEHSKETIFFILKFEL